MFFEHLHFDCKTQVIHDASIGDEVFRGAHVEWRKLSRGDMSWIFDHLATLVEHWPGVESTDVEAHLKGTLNESGEVSYALEVVGVNTPAPWVALDANTQREVEHACQSVLETIHAFLHIY